MKRIKTYKSGFRLIVEKTRSKTTHMRHVVCAGSLNEKKSEYGYSHFLEHLQSKSTKKRTTEQIAQEKTFYGIMEVDATSFHQTIYSSESLKENFEKLVEIEADRLQNGILDKDEVKTEKKVVLEEIKTNRTEPSRTLIRETDEIFFSNTPLNHKIAGLEENIINATPSKLRKFKEKYYTPNNTIISIAGDISFHKAEKLIKKYFPKLFEGESEPCKSFIFTGDNKIDNNYCIINRDMEQAKVLIQIKGLSNNHPHFYNQSTYSKILGAYDNSRLYDIIRKKLGYVYHIRSGAYSFMDMGVLYIEFDTSTKNIKPALIEIRKILKEIAENGVTNNEIKSTNNIIKTSFAAFLRKKYCEEIAEDNIYEMYYKRKIKTDKERFNLMEKVCKQDVQEYAKFIYNSKDFVVGAIGEGIKLSDLKVFGEIDGE